MRAFLVATLNQIIYLGAIELSKFASRTDLSISLSRNSKARNLVVESTCMSKIERLVDVSLIARCDVQLQPVRSGVRSMLSLNGLR